MGIRPLLGKREGFLEETKPNRVLKIKITQANKIEREVLSKGNNLSRDPEARNAMVVYSVFLKHKSGRGEAEKEGETSH